MKTTTAATEHSLEAAARLRLVLVRLARGLRRHGTTALTPSQLSALATLEEFGSLRISALATLESVGAPVATRVVTSLEQLELVNRTDDPDDRRACLVGLTAKGRLTLGAIWGERTLGLGTRLEGLSSSERARLDAALPILEKIARDG